MDFTRTQRECEALENRLVGDIGVEVSYLEHFEPDFGLKAELELVSMGRKRGPSQPTTLQKKSDLLLVADNL